MVDTPVFHHYYHVFADGKYWEEAVHDHLNSLKTVGSRFWMVVGIVGSVGNRIKARRVIEEHLLGFVDRLEISEYEDGWEQRTLQLLIDDLSLGRVNEPVLYTHTKGAANKTEVSTAWRGCMERNVVGKWEKAIELLRSGKSDSVGVHWIRKEEYPNSVEIPFYGGNYWWITSEFAKSLPELENSHRWGAEAWLGQGPPVNPIDLVPGHLWPGTPCSSH